MLAPQFTIRRLLLWTTVAAFVAFLAGFARQGAVWAQTIVFVILVIGLCFFCFAAMFLLAQIMSQGFSAFLNLLGVSENRNRTTQSPFAEHRPPPQLVPPEEPM